MSRTHLACLICFTAIPLAEARAAIEFRAILTQGQESPAVTNPTVGINSVGIDPATPRPISFGEAVFFLNDAETELSMSVVIFNIDVTGTQTPGQNDNLVNAHIHVATTNPGAATFPVRWGFVGAPDNDTTPKNLVTTAFATGVGGTFTSIWNAPEGNAGTTLATSLPNIKAGLSYINFHTVQFTGGEIRGQIGPEGFQGRQGQGCWQGS